MDISSARLYIAVLSAISLHSASRPAWILLKHREIIGARVDDCQGLLHDVHRTFRERYLQPAPMTLIGSTIPCIQCAKLVVALNIQEVFYLHPSLSVTSLSYMKSQNIQVRRLMIL